MPPDSADDSPRVYATRLTEPAEAEIDAAYLRLLSATSLRFADKWQDGLFAAIDGRARFPNRYEVASEAPRFRMPVRRMVYRVGQVVHRGLFSLLDEDGDGQEDTVRILHVRHGAQGPDGDEDGEQG